MEYLFANLLGVIPWLFFFSYRKDLRKEMLIMSAIAAPLGLLDIFFVSSYWQPTTLFNIPIGIEGVIFSFEIGGVAAVAYAELTHRVPIKIKKHHKKFSLSLLLLLAPLITLLYLNKFPNIMLATYVGLIVGISCIVYIRRDLLDSALKGAITFGGIYFVCFVVLVAIFPGVSNWFTLQNLPRLYILNVPVYEVIFAILFAAYWGNLYEVLFQYKFRKLTSRS